MKLHISVPADQTLSNEEETKLLGGEATNRIFTKTNTTIFGPESEDITDIRSISQAIVTGKITGFGIEVAEP